MKKTTIAITEETKRLMDEVIKWTNILLDLKTKNSTNCYFGQIESYEECLLNHALPALYDQTKESLRKYIPNIDEVM